jgi:hypothetical protein
MIAFPYATCTHLGSAVVQANAAVAPAAPLPAAIATAATKPWVNVADRAPADSIDRNIQNPGMVDLTAISATEAVIGLGGLGAVKFAIINLDSGCIVATRDKHDTLKAHTRESDEKIIEYLQSSAFAHEEAPNFADLLRFDLHEFQAVMTRTRSDGSRTISADRRKMAILVGDRVFYSADGGKRFERIGTNISLEMSLGVYLSPDDKLLYVDTMRGTMVDSKFFSKVVDVQNVPAKPLGDVALNGYTSLRVFSTNGKPLHANRDQRCIHELNSATLTLDKLLCLNGPKMPADFFFGPDLSPSGTAGVYIEGQARGVASIFEVKAGAIARSIPSKFNAQAYQSDVQGFHIGPDDAGRFGWDVFHAFRVATPTGVFDNAWLQPTDKHTPMGFDLAGNIVWFHQPPLIGPHLPMTLMPPAKGKLGDSMCTLISRTDPTGGKKVLPPL